MDYFRVIFSGLALLCIIVGGIGYKIKSSSVQKDVEFEARVHEKEKEDDRKLREEKELDDFMSDVNDEY